MEQYRVKVTVRSAIGRSLIAVCIIVFSVVAYLVASESLLPGLVNLFVVIVLFVAMLWVVSIIAREMISDMLITLDRGGIGFDVQRQRKFSVGSFHLSGNEIERIKPCGSHGFYYIDVKTRVVPGAFIIESQGNKDEHKLSFDKLMTAVGRLYHYDN